MEGLQLSCVVIVSFEIIILMGVLLEYLWRKTCIRIAKSKFAKKRWGDKWANDIDLGKYREAVNAGSSLGWTCQTCGYKDLYSSDRNNHWCPECLIKRLPLIPDVELIDFMMSGRFRNLSSGHSTIVTVHAVARVLKALNYKRKDEKFAETAIKTS